MKKRIIITSVIAVLVITLGVLSFFAVRITNNAASGTKSTTSTASDTKTTDLSYEGAVTLTSGQNISDTEYGSTTADENALLVTGDIDVSLDNIKVTKSGDSSGGDNTSFYGTNSAILAKDGANVTITNAEITTDAAGANGVFSYGGSATTNNSSSDGTTVTISDSVITTTKDNSGGIMTTGGGTMIAKNLTVNTAGTSSAAIRSDRGGGTVTVTKGTYSTTGKGSPAIYSTADITVNDATLNSSASEGVIIEGKNSITLNNCTLNDTNNTLNGKSTTYKNIFIYQSMSGDAKSGTATFSATDSSITTNKGDTIYVTNTTAEIYLKNNTFKNNDSTGNFLRIKADSWGNSGSNGGNVTLTADSQKIKGNIVVDSISTLIFNIKNGSSYEGVINGDNTAKSISLTLDASSKIKLTGDCYVTSFTNTDSTNSNIDFNGYKLYVNGVAVN
ncbi:MAG: hypothetical protein IKF53_02225 [Clostridia bacterium]|nr:hypothetical protein [Clostridia bacterium]